MNADMEIVWDGRVDRPDRGYLNVLAHATRPAPPLALEVRGANVRTGANAREWTIHLLEDTMGIKAWTSARLAIACGCSDTAVQRALRRCVRDGRVVMAGVETKSPSMHGPAAMLYRWNPEAES